MYAWHLRQSRAQLCAAATLSTSSPAADRTSQDVNNFPTSYSTSKWTGSEELDWMSVIERAVPAPILAVGRGPRGREAPRQRQSPPARRAEPRRYLLVLISGATSLEALSTTAKSGSPSELKSATPRKRGPVPTVNSPPSGDGLGRLRTCLGRRDSHTTQT